MKKIQIQRVAVLDDRKQALQQIEDRLKKNHGLDVVVINSPRTCINVLKAQHANKPLHAIFVDADWTRRGESQFHGLTIIENIKENGALRNIPTILYTQFGWGDLQEIGNWLDDQTPYIRYGTLIRANKLRRAVNGIFKRIFKTSLGQFILGTP